MYNVPFDPLFDGLIFPQAENLCEQNAVFSGTVNAFILVVSITIGIETDSTDAELHSQLNVISDIALGVFTVECVVKLVATGFEPWQYYGDSWNRFDFGIVALRDQWGNSASTKQPALQMIAARNQDLSPKPENKKIS